MRMRSDMAAKATRDCLRSAEVTSCEGSLEAEDEDLGVDEFLSFFLELTEEEEDCWGGEEEGELELEVEEFFLLPGAPERADVLFSSSPVAFTLSNLTCLA